MPTVTAQEAELRFGQLLHTVQREPVTITKNGREVAVVVALDRPEQVAALEAILADQYWGEQAIHAEQAGYLSVAESEALLKDCLNA